MATVTEELNEKELEAVFPIAHSQYQKTIEELSKNRPVDNSIVYKARAMNPYSWREDLASWSRKAAERKRQRAVSITSSCEHLNRLITKHYLESKCEETTRTYAMGAIKHLAVYYKVKATRILNEVIRIRAKTLKEPINEIIAGLRGNPENAEKIKSLNAVKNWINSNSDKKIITIRA
ncbi:MAG: hypothetical protein KDE30_13190 [Novosphingobium sp.]|nr:hypothetical protein [Novosphingobium sp.]